MNRPGQALRAEGQPGTARYAIDTGRNLEGKFRQELGKGGVFGERRGWEQGWNRGASAGLIALCASGVAAMFGGYVLINDRIKSNRQLREDIQVQLAERAARTPMVAHQSCTVNAGERDR